MLDDFKEQQPIVYRMMKNAVASNKISHAYLLDIKNYSFGNEMALAFVKYLLCPLNNSDFINCGNCTQCQKIDSLNYTELKIIDPDGIWIKKEQMDNLQEEFSKKAIEGNYKIYIIHQVERLNKSAANSLLKFLEEPEEGIIAILTTNNLFQVLETIRSRCQIFSFINEKKQENQKSDMIDNLIMYVKINIFDINTEEGKEKLNNFAQIVLQFIETLEKKGTDALLYTGKLWHNHISEKEELLLAFDIMISFYSDVLNHQCERTLKIFSAKQDLIFEIISKNSINDIVRKINILTELKQKIKVNVNNNLLIDKLIMSFGGE